ncbi:MAG: HDOD domain-containing protein [Gammaproteobacteria bacterium]
MHNADTHAIAPVEQQSFEALLDDVEGLVSPPDVCMRLFELIHSPKSSSRDIGGVVSVDPNLTARLLRMANSSFYNLGGKIDTVSRAVTIIGNSELYSLVLSISAVKSFTNIPNDIVTMETFWKHSVYTGLLARALARRVNMLHPERMFVAGLLHDIGSLVLYHYRAETMRDILLVSNGDEEVMYHAENETLGFNHASLAGGLLEEWNLPEELQQAVSWHHEPGMATTARLEAHLLYLANVMVNESEQGNFIGLPLEASQINTAIMEEAGVSSETMFAAFEEAAEQFPSTVQALL